MNPESTLNPAAAGFGLGPITITADGLTAYMGNGTTGYYDGLIASRGSTAASFGAPALIAAPVNQDGGGVGEDFPTWVTPDGGTLYFISNRTGSNARDIWTAKWTGSGFSAPVQVNALNSSENENTVILTPDELQAFVGRSSGLYYSSRASTAAGFSPPVKLTGLGNLSAGVSWVTPGWVQPLPRNEELTRVRSSSRWRHAPSERSPLPVFVSLAQRALQELAGGRARDGVDEHERVGHRPLRDLGRQVRSSSSSVTVAPSFFTTTASGRSAHFGCGTATTAASFTAGMAHQRVLELDRADPLAARLDQVLGAVGDLRRSRARRSSRRRRS